jgi:tetratricopeptide (TPR) repeat protein
VERVVDDADFGILTMSSPDCPACDRFLARHPTTVHCAELHFKVAQIREAHADSGDASVRSGAAQAYAKAAAECVASDPLLPRALLGCARNLHALGKNDSASSKLKDFFARFEDSSCASEGYYLRGLVLKSRRLLSEALDQFKKVLDSYPLSVVAEQARYEAATAYLAMGSYEEALDEFRLCGRNGATGDRGAEVRLGASRCLRKLSRPDEAVVLLLDIVQAKVAPDCAGDAYTELSEIAQSKGQVREAVEYCAKAIAIDGYARKNEAIVALASLHFCNRMYADAAAAYKRALPFVKSRKDSASVCAGMASALFMDGRRAEAESASQFFKTRFGVACEAYSQIVYHEGLAALVSKDYDKARSRFNYILDRYPESTWSDGAAYQSALSWYYAGKTEVALDKFNAFLTMFPRSTFAGCADFKIGMIYHDQNDFEQASKYFASALYQLSTDRMTRFRAAHNAAIDLQKLSRWLDAARMYETTIDSFPEEINPSSGFLKTGFCFLQASRYDEALRLFAKASVNPGPEEKPEILYWIATCWARQGELRKAAAEYLKVPALYVGLGRWGLTSECEAARIFEKLGEYKKALDLYRKIVRFDGETGELGRDAASRIEQLSTITENEQ